MRKIKYKNLKFLILILPLVLFISCSKNQSVNPNIPLSREDAIKMIQSFGEANHIKTMGFNEENLWGIYINYELIVFEYIPDQKTLRCSALIYRFPEPPKPGLIEAFQKEEKSGTDTGGGTVEYWSENQGIFLTRIYKNPVDGSLFTKDIEKLMKARSRWDNEVFERVASQFFHPEE